MVLSRAKEWLLLDHLRVKGPEQAFIHACLSFSAMLTAALTAIKQHKPNHKKHKTLHNPINTKEKRIKTKQDSANHQKEKPRKVEATLKTLHSNKEENHRETAKSGKHRINEDF